LLMFAHPCEAGAMVIRPAASLAEEDLIVANNTNQQLLRVPVNATYDPLRRVGQPFFNIPPGGWGTTLDMEYDLADHVYLLDGWRVLKIKDGASTMDAYFTATR